ncbi:hypothetical protein SDC9_211355 [bioreactor metagenome]|uniref:Uncharacterized protein n=1 Tax=bioreactor metagenome TaxID=1076179 RepID=A0A645JJ03_9ZZZZ
MGDEQHARAQFALQFVHHLQHLGLNRHIQRGSGLVRQQQHRVTGQRDGNDNALLHAARKLMGIFSLPLRLQPHRRQHLIYPLRPLLGREIGVQQHGLLNLLSHRNNGVQTGHRVLKHHRNAVAPDLPQLGLRHRRYIEPIE